MPTFKQATDALGIPAPELALHFRVGAQSIRQMRMDPGSDGYRSPPDGWELVVAKLARQRGGELVKLADQLEGEKK